MSARVRLGAAVVLLAAGVAAGQATAGSVPRPSAGQSVAVTSRTLVCPDVLQDGDRGATAVTAAGGTGRTAGPLGRAAGPLPVQPVVGELGRDLRGPLVVTSAGSGAGALSVEQVTRATSGTRRGLAGLACSAPAASSWFVGGSTVLGSTSELLLVNVEATPAVVDVRLWSAGGPAESRPGRALAVPAHGRLVVPLDRLAPDRDLLALHVQAVRGRVASALRVARADGRTPLGVDWVPAAQPPARDVVVPGLPAGPGGRTAIVSNPGERDAVVSVELTTDDGQYTPEGLESVPVPAGTSIAVDLTAQLSQTPAAVRVRSDGPPLLAGALVVDAGRGAIREIAFSASTSALQAPGLVAGGGSSGVLLLSALAEDAVVELVPLGGGPSQRVEVTGATTVAVPLAPLLQEDAPAVEVRPVTGQIHAARYVHERASRGPLTTLLPLTPGLLAVPRPVVVADPGAGR